MPTNATILLDSINEYGNRLVTFELTYPRIIHAEIMTHRVFSRNSASSRAIPVKKMVERVRNDPFIPSYWGENQSGMVAEKEVSEAVANFAREEWLKACAEACCHAWNLQENGLHKQLANRLLEPFMYHTIILTATEFSNFFALRCHPEAQPEIREAAELMRTAMAESTPTLLRFGEWHMPLVPDAEQLRAEWRSEEHIRQISAGRCARVSYLTHAGKRDPQADVDLCERLVANGHMSPLEHVATPDANASRQSNFRGWRQYRRDIPYESDFGARQ